MSQSLLLPLLADGEFRSGQDLADALGVSRAAVWKQVNKLTRETGIEIESVKGRGYRIRGGLDLLSHDEVVAGLASKVRAQLSELDVRDAIDSTNAEALRRAQEGAASGLVVTAEQQSAGRGRRGRHWVSPYARNLYVSLLWQFDEGAAALEGLSLAVGVAVAQALEACGMEDVALKWPNDVLVNRAKLGGILIEMSGDAAGRCQVVIGVGVNVAMPVNVASDIDQAWTDVATHCGGQVPARSQLLAALLNELIPVTTEFAATGFAPLREAWMERDAYADAQVILDTGARQMAGVARGVDTRGALSLETTTGIQSVYGGEISLRPVQ